MVASSDPQPLTDKTASNNARPPEAAAARARRTLAASRAARAGISNMVEALRISRPPKAPGKHAGNAVGGTSTTARRHALIPLAEGRDQLEARIRALEDVVSARDEALIRLKRQLGRTLIRRRHSEREHDNAVASLAHAVSTARSFHAAALSARSDLQTVVEDISASLRAARETEGSDIHIVLDDVSASIEIATAKLDVALPAFTLDEPVPSVRSQPLSRPRAPSSIAPSDEDSRSCASYASSALGDDRDAQIEALIELVDILDAKLSTGPPHQGATNVLNRARRTVASLRVEQNQSNGTVASMVDCCKNENGNGNEDEDMIRRQSIVRIIDEVLAEMGNDTGFSATDDMVKVVAARAELREARAAAERARGHVTVLEKAAERVGGFDDILERNNALQQELAVARRTITRLIQDRGPLRRFGATSAGGTPASVARGASRAMREDEDAMRRVLDWQQSTSTAGNRSTTNNPNESSRGDVERESEIGDGEKEKGAEKNVGDRIDSHDSLQEGWNSRRPDRDDSPALPAPSRPSRRIRGGGSTNGLPSQTNLHGNATDEASLGDDAAVSEKSVEMANEDTGSTQSMPIRGILRRHDSLSSLATMNASGDEITIRNRHKIFGSGPRATDGLRSLLGG